MHYRNNKTITKKIVIMLSILNTILEIYKIIYI